MDFSPEYLFMLLDFPSCHAIWNTFLKIKILYPWDGRMVEGFACYAKETGLYSAGKESQGRFLRKKMTYKRHVKEMPAAESLAWSGRRLGTHGRPVGEVVTLL